MLITDSQRRFAQDFMTREGMVMPAVVSQIWAQTAEANAATLALQNAEERTELLTQAVDKAAKAIALKWINANITDESKRAHYLRRLREGQLLVARTRGSQAFDKILLPEDLKSQAPLDLELLTPTLQFSTTDLREVMNEQSRIKIVAQMQEWVNVEDSSLDGNQITVSVINRKNNEKGQVVVKIDPTQPSSLLFDKGAKAKGERYVSATQNPEDFGNIMDSVIQIQDPLKAATAITMMNEKNNVDKTVDKANAMLTGLATGLAADALNRNKAAQNATAAQDALLPKDTQVQIHAPSNVMKSKVELQKKKMEDEQKRMQKRRAKAQKEQDLKLKRKIASDRMKQKKARKSKADSRMGYAGMGAALTGGLVAGGGSFGTYLLLFT